MLSIKIDFLNIWSKTRYFLAWQHLMNIDLNVNQNVGFIICSVSKKLNRACVKKTNDHDKEIQEEELKRVYVYVDIFLQWLESVHSVNYCHGYVGLIRYASHSHPKWVVWYLGFVQRSYVYENCYHWVWFLCYL